MLTCGNYDRWSFLVDVVWKKTFCFRKNGWYMFEWFCSDVVLFLVFLMYFFPFVPCSELIAMPFLTWICATGCLATVPIWGVKLCFTDLAFLSIIAFSLSPWLRAQFWVSEYPVHTFLAHRAYVPEFYTWYVFLLWLICPMHVLFCNLGVSPIVQRKIWI